MSPRASDLRRRAGALLKRWGDILTGAPAAAGPYKAARPSRTLGGAARFYNRGSPADILQRNLAGLIAHSRDAARNSDVFRGYLATLERNVIGPEGLALSLDIRDAAGARDRAAIGAVRGAWRRWAKHGAPTMCGGYSLRAALLAMLRACAKDGQCFVRHYRGRAAGPFGYRIKILPVDLLDVDYVAELSDGGAIIGGIELDPDDRIRAYHMFRRHPRRGVRLGARERIRIPAAQITYVRPPAEAGFVLAEPWGVAVLRRLSQMGDFEDAAVANASAGARKVGYLTEERPEEISDAAAGLDAALHDPEPGGDIEYVDPGLGWTYLPPGVEPKPFDNKYPDGEIEPFARLMHRGMAAGLNLSYASLTSDMTGANFSSLRAGLTAERDEWRMLQAWISEAVLDPIFAAWLPMALLSGQIAGYGAADEAYLACASWRGRGWPAVNPREEAASDNIALGDATISRVEIARRRGRDLEEVFAEIREAEELAAEYGVTFGGAGDPAALEEAPAPAPDPDADPAAAG